MLRNLESKNSLIYLNLLHKAKHEANFLVVFQIFNIQFAVAVLDVFAFIQWHSPVLLQIIKVHLITQTIKNNYSEMISKFIRKLKEDAT